MKEPTVEPRWFVVNHGCGAEFTINTVEFCRNFRVGFTIRCPNCLQMVNEAVLGALYNFLGQYEALIRLFRADDFSIKEIENNRQDSDS